MPARIKFITAVCFALSVFANVQQADAQLRRSRQPLQAPMRWLGQGWSTGYHWQNSGPNSDYYNPYTAHNSYLVSQQPGYQDNTGQYHGQGQLLGAGVPYSVYSPTNGTGGQDWSQGQGQMIQPSFQPSNAASDRADESSDEDDESAAEQEAADADEGEDFNEGMPNISSDPNEPGSIRVDEDTEDGDFEESSTDAAGDEAIENSNDADVSNASFRRRARTNDRDLDFSSFMVN